MPFSKFATLLQLSETKDLNHRLTGEMSGRLIENVPLNDFMGTFLKSSEYKDPVAHPVFY